MAYRAKRVRKERALAMRLAQQERALPDKGKALLSKVAEMDGDHCMAYKDMASHGGMVIYSEKYQKKREGKLIKMMLAYIAAHPDALAEAQQAADYEEGCVVGSRCIDREARHKILKLMRLSGRWIRGRIAEQALHHWCGGTSENIGVGVYLREWGLDGMAN